MSGPVNPRYFYKTVDVPNWQAISSKMRLFVEQRPKVFGRGYHINLMRLDEQEVRQECPELNRAFDHLNLKVTDVMVFVLWNQDQCGIHKDTWHHAARINMPLLNCEGSFTAFYSDDEPSVRVKNGQGKFVEVLKNQVAPIQCKFELAEPTVMRVLSFHKVLLPRGVRNAPRISLSLGFDIDPVVLLESSPTVN